MDFNFGISLNGSFKTVLRHLQKELCDNMIGRGAELQLQNEYKFKMNLAASEVEIQLQNEYKYNMNPAASVVQLLLYLQFHAGDTTADAGVIGYCQCRWNVPTEPATDDDWKKLWIPMFRRSSKEEPLPSKLLNRKITCGAGIQHLRMYPPGNDTAYVFLLHDWRGRMLWIPYNDHKAAVQRVLQYQHQIHLLGNHPGHPSYAEVEMAYEVSGGTISQVPCSIEKFNIQTPNFNQKIYQDALRASQPLPQDSTTQTTQTGEYVNDNAGQSTRTHQSQGVGSHVLHHENNHHLPHNRNIGPHTSDGRGRQEARVDTQQSQTAFRDGDRRSIPTGARRNNPGDMGAPPDRVGVPPPGRQAPQHPAGDPRHVNFQQTSSCYPENSLRTPQLSQGSTWDTDEGTYETAGSSSHAHLDTRGPDLHEDREPVVHDAMNHNLRRHLRTNPSGGSAKAMYDYPYLTSDGPMAPESEARSTDQSLHPLLNQAANLRESQVFHPRLVEVIGDNSRHTSTSVSQQSWNSIPTSTQWKEADKNQLLQLLHTLKQKQQKEEAGRRQSSHSVAPTHQQPASGHSLTQFQGANNQGGSSFSFNFSTEQLNNAVGTLQSQLERLNIRREPLPMDDILAQQTELKEQIEIQMAGINKVTCQIKALTSDSSDADEVENWSLDVIIASTSPDLLSTNLHERVAMMNTINNRLEKKLTKQANKLKKIKDQQRSNASQQGTNQLGPNLQEPRRSPRMLNVDSMPDLSALPFAERRRLQTDMQY